MFIKELHKTLSKQPNTNLIPVLFIGHGSPMNAIENNIFTKEWSKITDFIPTPRAIICISAHWETKGTFATGNIHPKTIHDFYGFPEELYEQDYPAIGYPGLIKDLEGHFSRSLQKTLDWGLDHGTWSVLKHLYPKADIPVIQISLDQNKTPQQHYELAQELQYLRKKGILFIGSGNIIHNLRLMQLRSEDINDEFGFDWALETNAIIKTKLKNQETNDLIDYKKLSKDISLSVPTPEHYLPLIYSLGLKTKNEEITLFNDRLIAGSLSMTSLLIK